MVEGCTQITKFQELNHSFLELYDVKIFREEVRMQHYIVL